MSENFEPKIINEENLDTLINGDKPVLIDFFATWCGPCQMMLPLIHEIAKEEKEERFVVGVVDIDESPSIAGKFGVMSVPTFLIAKEGKEVVRFVGAMPKDTLLDKIKSAI